MNRIGVFVYIGMLVVLLNGAVLAEKPPICYESEPFDELMFPQINGNYWHVTTQRQPGCESNYCLTTLSNSNILFAIEADGNIKGASKTLSVWQIKWDGGLLDCIDPEARDEILRGNPEIGDFFKAISKIEIAKMLRLFINARNTMIREWYYSFYDGIVKACLAVGSIWQEIEISTIDNAFRILFERSWNAREKSSKTKEQEPENKEDKGGVETADVSVEESVFGAENYIPFMDPTALKEVIGPVLDAIKAPESKRTRVIEDSFEANKGKIDLVIRHMGPVYLYVVSEEDNLFTIAWPLKAVPGSVQDNHCMYMTVRILQSDTMVHMVSMSTVLAQASNCALDPNISDDEKKLQRGLLKEFKLRPNELASSYPVDPGNTDERKSRSILATADVTVEDTPQLASDDHSLSDQGVLSNEVLPSVRDDAVKISDSADHLDNPGATDQAEL
ncbi:MAG: hypothetical protein J0G29_02745 [Alphaproteobacteria bacterium]|nr:hypothetical protein [Alphaproteobacteria bacterium]OJV45196.1 MAG: hypothetical protein BGO28_00120 [Alphaproteobacteria bacterium 43-37]